MVTALSVFLVRVMCSDHVGEGNSSWSLAVFDKLCECACKAI